VPTCREVLDPIIDTLDEIGVDPLNIDITSFGPTLNVCLPPEALGMLAQLRELEPVFSMTTSEGAHYSLTIDTVRYWASMRWSDMSYAQRVEAMERSR